MTIKQFIEKAIKGEWRPKFDSQQMVFDADGNWIATNPEPL